MRWRVAYYSRGDHMRLEVQIIHTKPIFGNVEVISVCPIKNNPRNIGIRTMGKDKDTMIIEVRFCKCKKILIVWFMELVPSKHIGGEVGHQQNLGNVREEQIEALMSCRRGVHMRTTYPNIQLKLHEKTKARKKNKQSKRIEAWKMTKWNIQTLAMNSWMRVYAGRGPSAKLESCMNCTMSTFFIKASMLGASEDVALVSKRAASLLRGKERREVPLCEGVAINCGPKAEGVPKGATDGAKEGVIDRLRGKVEQLLQKNPSTILQRANGTQGTWLFAWSCTHRG